MIRAFQDGASAESIVDSYSTLTLANAYGAISYYLRHQDSVEAYLKREQLAELVKQGINAIQPNLSHI